MAEVEALMAVMAVHWPQRREPDLALPILCDVERLSMFSERRTRERFG